MIGIVSSILRHLNHNELDSLSQTCVTAYNAVAFFRKSAMKIEHVLLRFFKNKEEIGMFQYMQGTTGTIISGSVALQFFTRTLYDNSDLDTYCILKKCITIGKWYELVGYQFVPVKNQHHRFDVDYDRVLEGGHFTRINQEGNEGDDIQGAAEYLSIDIAEVWNFARKDGAHIQLVATRIIPEAIVLGFHSTCVMNIITHRAAYSLFPYTTFKKKLTVLVNARGRLLQKYVQAVQKYRHRGFTMNTRVPIKNAIEGEYGFIVPRWIGDKSTWVYPVEYFGQGEVPDSDEAERVSWDVVQVGRQIFLEAQQLFEGDKGRYAYEENRQFLLASIELEMVRRSVREKM
ncbi:hypothetical protein EV361DRAFT_811430 [Lentinula raphanica]|nr:hypothetical protein EV361DRAFT_811430 [Lentinula raphanica]